jgi:alpha-L-fucosidase 2
MALAGVVEPPGWTGSPEALVSRNDVVYTSLSPEPWDAMPVGGGDLSAMVRCDGESVHLHLTKSDAWGFQASADAPLGSRFFNNVSPGHVRIVLGPRGKEFAARRFRQQLDLYRGRIVIELGEGDEVVRFSIWGHPERRVIFVEVDDPGQSIAEPIIELSEWRETMGVSVDGDCLRAAEVHTRPAAPHMATSGMEDYFSPKDDPLRGRGTAVVVGVGDLPGLRLCADDTTASLTLPAEHPGKYIVAIACAVTAKGDAAVLAKREYEGAIALPLDILREEHAAWWREFWSKSSLRIESGDGMGQRLTGAYHVHLYTLGCVNRGPVPAKWDGGPGLMRGDERTWGLAEWVQEIRFTYLPLYAANHLEMAKGLTDHYTRMLPFLREQTKRMWDVPGLWIPETVLPWGGVEDWILRNEDGAQSYFKAWDPASAPYGKFQRYNQYVGFLFTCGPELCGHYLAYYRYTGDETFLREEAYPLLRGVAEFLSGLLRKGDDGRFHLDPANALETWWMARDPADAMAGIEWLFTEFVALAERLGSDKELRERLGNQLAALPDPPLGVWSLDGTVDDSIDAYAPAAAPGDPPQHRNFENPALYRVFPFGLSGIGADDHPRAVRTFEHRIFSGGQSWSMDAIWAARLGLGEEAGALLAAHTRKWHRFRYGGWDSGNSTVFPDGLAVVPYTDGAGVACFALHEMLLQSHGGLIRVLPAVPADWSGAFQLRAENGFLVAVDFEKGVPNAIKIHSLSDASCALANPWGKACVVRDGGETVLRSEEETIRFETRAGKTYTVEIHEDL